MTRLDKKLANTTSHQPEEPKACLTERRSVKVAAGSSTTSAATLNNVVPTGLSSGQQTRNER